MRARSKIIIQASTKFAEYSDNFEAQPLQVSIYILRYCTFCLIGETSIRINMQHLVCQKAGKLDQAEQNGAYCSDYVAETSGIEVQKEIF